MFLLRILFHDMYNKKTIIIPSAMEDLWFVAINKTSKETAINVLIGSVTRMISGRVLNSISL